MTTEQFVEMRVRELRNIIRGWYGPHWRRTIARKMRRWDVPRFLVARPGRHPVTFKQLVLVENLLLQAGYTMGCPRFSGGMRRCPEDAGYMRQNTDSST